MATKESSFKAIDELYRKLRELYDIEIRLGYFQDAEELNANTLHSINIQAFNSRELEAFLKMLRDSYYGEETKFLVHLFQNTNAKDKELERITGISASTIGRRLNPMSKSGDDPFIGYKIAFGEYWEDYYQEVVAKRQENLSLGKTRGGHISQINNISIKDELGHFQGILKPRLDLFSNNPDTQIKVLTNIASYFGLNIESIAMIFGMEEVEIYDLLKNANYPINSDQQKAIKEFKEFYIEYIKSKTNNYENNPTLLEVKGVVKSFEVIVGELALNEESINMEERKNNRYA